MKIVFVWIICLFLVSCANTQRAQIHSKKGTGYVLVKSVQPSYPESARQKLVQGYVGLAYTINSEGIAENIWVIEETPKGIFTQEAINTLSQYRWETTDPSLQGKSSKERAIKINFTLSREDIERIKLCQRESSLFVEQSCKELH